MSETIRWGRSNEGNVDSKCGGWGIAANYCGTCRPQDYNLWDYRDGPGGAVRRGVMIATQAEAKADAQTILDEEAEGTVER